MKIGELGKITGISTDTLRYYTREDLLNYIHVGRCWEYSEDQIERVKYIVMLRSLDFSIKEIHYIFNFSENLLKGKKVNHGKVAEYKEFFEKKLDTVLKQKESIMQVESRIEKILSKLSYLESVEIFEV